jgi:hypothetical protein
MLDLDKFKEALEADLEDPNGYWNTLKRKDEIKALQVERFKQKAEADLTGTMAKLLAKYESDEYRDREYRMGYEPREDLLWLAFEYARTYCVECDDDKYLNDFTGEAYYIGNYVIQIMHGQGSCIRVDEIEGPILPNKRERLVQMIESRIKTEYEKHSKSLPEDWAKIAAVKILASLNESENC